jgi:hypothetical protein
MVDRRQISAGRFAAGRRGRWRFLVGTVDESCAHHLSNPIDFDHIGPLFGIENETFGNEQTKLKATRRASGRRARQMETNLRRVEIRRQWRVVERLDLLS